MDDRQSKRKALSPGPNSSSAKKAPVAPMVTVKKPAVLSPVAMSEKAAAQGLSGVTSHYFSRAELEELEAEEESSNNAGNNTRPPKRQGTRSSSNATNGATWDGTPAAAEGADSAAQLDLLSSAEGELRVSFDAHMKYLSEAEEAKLAEMAAFQKAGEAALQNMEQSRKATTDDALRLHKAFVNQRQRITRLRMEEVDQERARNQLESEKREARLKAEKEALSLACKQEAEELGNAWAVVEAAAGFAPGQEGDGSAANSSSSSNNNNNNNNSGKMEHLVAAAGAGEGRSVSSDGAENGGGGGGGGGGKGAATAASPLESTTGGGEVASN
ncbi:unnamed protein product [Scytosiphon promiscuus]